MMLYKVSDSISESDVHTFVYDDSGLGMNRDIITAVDNPVTMQEDNSMEIEKFSSFWIRVFKSLV